MANCIQAAPAQLILLAGRSHLKPDLDMRLWVRPQGVDQIWELSTVSDEKDRDAVANQVPIALTSIAAQKEGQAVDAICV